MPVGNVVLVRPDPDRWQTADPDQGLPEVPAFKKVIVGPLPLELEGFFGATLTHPDFPLALTVLAFVVWLLIIVVPLLLGWGGGKP